MDLNGKNDPYVKLRLGTQTAETRVLMKTNDPVWDEHFVFGVNSVEAQQLHLSVCDYDMFKHDDHIGSCNVGLSHLPCSSSSSQDSYLAAEDDSYLAHLHQPRHEEEEDHEEEGEEEEEEGEVAPRGIGGGGGQRGRGGAARAKGASPPLPSPARSVARSEAGGNGGRHRRRRPWGRGRRRCGSDTVDTANSERGAVSADDHDLWADSDSDDHSDSSVGPDDRPETGGRTRTRRRASSSVKDAITMTWTKMVRGGEGRGREGPAYLDVLGYRPGPGPGGGGGSLC